MFTCDDFGGGATVAITVVIGCRLRGRRHAGSGPRSGSRPGWAREGAGVVGRHRVGGRAVVRRCVGRGGAAGRGGLELPLGALRGLRRRVARRLDQGFFAEVTSRGDGWVGAAGLGGKGDGLPGWGRGLFFGPFRRKPSHHNNVNEPRHGDRRPLTSVNHVWTSSSGSTLGMGDSHCQEGQTIPLGRGCGRELPSLAAEIEPI